MEGASADDRGGRMPLVESDGSNEEAILKWFVDRRVIDNKNRGVVMYRKDAPEFVFVLRRNGAYR